MKRIENNEKNSNKHQQKRKTEKDIYECFLLIDSAKKTEKKKKNWEHCALDASKFELTKSEFVINVCVVIEHIISISWKRIHQVTWCIEDITFGNILIKTK